MTLHGVDISHFNEDFYVSRTNAQFVIQKVSEGTSYIDPTWRDRASQVEKAGRLLGFYHFYRGGGAREADYFINQIGAYLGEALLALDFEDDNHIHDIAGVKAWLDRVHERTGITPVLYINQNFRANSGNWAPVANAGYGLWMAHPGDSPGPIDPWKTLTLWQSSWSGKISGYSGPLDIDAFYGTRDDWARYAAGTHSDSDTTPSDSDTGGLLPMSTLTTYRRRDDLTVPVGEWKTVNLVNEDAAAKQFAVYTGPGPYYAVANILPRGGGCWAQFFLTDKTDKGTDEVSHETKVWIPEGGGQVASYGNVGEPKNGRRQLRLRVQAKGKGVTVDDIQTRVGTV